MRNADMPAMPCKQTVSRDSDEMIPYQFGNHDFVTPGLTKREHFAAMAMQGLLASWGQHDVAAADEIVSDAVTFADALLAELERTS